MMVSMYSIVGSDLRSLQEASWLLISYNLGYSIALPICGKFAQIYGRKHPLLVMYALFAIGNLWVGLSGSLWVAVAGRFVTGLGGAGLIGIVSVIITVTNLVPFQIYSRAASNTVAALQMLPNTFGIAVGGLISGMIFTRYPRYKLPTLVFAPVGIAAYLGISLRWTRSPDDNSGVSELQRHPSELLYLFALGISFGWTMSAQFAGMARSTPRRFSAEGVTAYYLAQQVGCVIGTNAAAKLLRNVFKEQLQNSLPSGRVEDPGWNRNAIIEEIIKDARFYQKLPKSISLIVRKSYLSAFRYIPLLSICAHAAAIGVQLLLPETYGYE
ncbi:Vacuolar membrane amino acid uptake transporter fnx2 [Lasiodiplodia theobromae]|uniref:Vacuolar membrane amino acid uptake transporter fnx2 n=1 Tax=Lasiodiplodia theobromae TaxID=45133 RepID=A0A5N5CV51_9PEZI|nr:Vacuolar membrane amino acid uptake transporter fnx2 [Lasiodiplodia theobromae]